MPSSSLQRFWFQDGASLPRPLPGCSGCWGDPHPLRCRPLGTTAFPGPSECPGETAGEAAGSWRPGSEFWNGGKKLCKGGGVRAGQQSSGWPVLHTPSALAPAQDPGNSTGGGRGRSLLGSPTSPQVSTPMGHGCHFAPALHKELYPVQRSLHELRLPNETRY